jgi:proliferating cell nuclear antigen
MSAESDKYILELHTSQCTKFKYLFSVIRDLLFDCNIHFDDSGMKICNLDNSKVALVHLRLPRGDKGCFSYYHCPKPIILGVSITALHKYLGYISQNNKYTLKLMVAADKPHELILEIVNDADMDVQRFHMKLLDLEMDEGGLEGERFSCIINMPSSKFQNYCRCHALVGDVMDIITVGDRVELNTEPDGGAGGDTAYSVIKTTSSEDDEEEDSPAVKDKTSILLTDRDDTIAGRFSLRFLQMFAKAQNLSPNVIIYFKQNFPLVLLYKMRDFGELKFALAPQVHPSAF